MKLIFSIKLARVPAEVFVSQTNLLLFCSTDYFQYWHVQTNYCILEVSREVVSLCVPILKAISAGEREE